MAVTVSFLLSACEMTREFIPRQGQEEEVGYFGIHLLYEGPDGKTCKNTRRWSWPRAQFTNPSSLPVSIRTEAGPIRLMCGGKDMYEIPPGGTITISNVILTQVTFVFRSLPSLPYYVNYTKSNGWMWGPTQSSNVYFGSDVGLTSFGNLLPTDVILRGQYGARFEQVLALYTAEIQEKEKFRAMEKEIARRHRERYDLAPAEQKSSPEANRRGERRVGSGKK